jgi:hypothetical protein
MKPILKAKCDGCQKPIFEKNKAVLVSMLTLCPICLGKVKDYFASQIHDISKIKREIKAEMCDQCSYNPYHDQNQIFYR